jgi:hypothetical protein
VAPPNGSNQNYGRAARYNLAFLMEHEPWHVETAKARSIKKPVTVPEDIKGYIEEAAQ